VTLSGGGTLENTTLVKNRFNNTWRLVIYIRPTGSAPIDMSARLMDNNRDVTETWSYQWVR
jgi:glucan biosynthesis protein